MDSRLIGDRHHLPPGTVRTTPPFVGRQEQLHWVEGCLQDVAAGQPRVVLVAGEAGVGKTRLLTEIRGLAQQQHYKMYYGRCYEDLALPYLPFVRTVFEEAVHELHTLGPDMQSDAEVIGNFLRHGSASARPPSDPTRGQTEQDKLRLFVAVAHATLVLAQQHPCVFVADDLHWADSPTLDLFTHLVFSLADAATRQPVRLCLMATYRPVAAVERLGRLLARLQRETICYTLALHGLAETDVAQIMHSLGVRRPSHQLVATIHAITRGNPLFVQEIVHHLHQHGGLQERGGFLVATTALADLRLPQQVHMALAARTQDLTAEQQRVFTLAACLGDHFSWHLLSAVSEVEEEPLLTLLEEGIRQHFFVSEGPGFHFAHPLIRQAMFSTISIARQQRLHAHIAITMERLYADNLDIHLLDIARHIVAASTVVAAETVLRYARRAADQAFALFSWRVAAHYYEAALAALAAMPSASPHEQATLHYRAGLAYHRDQDVGPCLDHYDQAIVTYRLTDDRIGLARAMLEKTRLQYTLAAIPLGVHIDVQALEAILQTLPATEVRLSGEIAAVLAEAYWTGRQTAQAYAMATRALDIGRCLEDAALCCHAYFALGMAQVQELHLHECQDSWQHSVQYARHSNDPALLGLPLPRLPVVLAVLGQLSAAATLAEEAQRITQETHNWSDHSTALSSLTALAAIRGDFVGAQTYAQATMQMASRSHYPWGAVRALQALVGVHVCCGEWEAAAAALHTLQEPEGMFAQPGERLAIFVQVFRLLLQAYAGQPHHADVLSLMTTLQGRAGDDTYALSPYCAAIELAALQGLPMAALVCTPPLTLAAERGAVFSLGWPFLIPRVLGLAATVRGAWSQAEAYFQQAQTIATEVGAGPELGRTYADWAQMLLLRDPQQAPTRARELAQKARSIFQEYAMHPFFQRTTQLLARCQEAPSWELSPLGKEPPLPHVVPEHRLVQLARRRTGFLA